MSRGDEIGPLQSVLLILELQAISLFVVGWELVLYYHHFFEEDEWFNWRFHNFHSYMPLRRTSMHEFIKNFILQNIFKSILIYDKFCDFPSCCKLVLFNSRLCSYQLITSYLRTRFLALLCVVIILVHQNSKKWSPNWHYECLNKMVYYGSKQIQVHI